MAGGEFRFGTASIYMAKQKPIRFPGTNHQSVITWPRFGQFHDHSAGISAGLIVSTRGKLGLVGWTFIAGERMQREQEGAAPSTVRCHLAALSSLFKHLGILSGMESSSVSPG